MATAPAPLRWQACRFEDLAVHALQRIHTARQQVFIIEQDCIYLDADSIDPHCWHLAAWHDGQALPWAYARVVPPGVKYAEPSIGRVLTTAPARGSGLGRELVRRAVALSREVFPGAAIRISAQSRLETFYAGFGFAIVGERYVEDGIPHTEMLLAAG